VSQSVRDARIEVIGQQDVKNEAHADAVSAILRAYGDSERGFVYVEPYLPKRAIRPNDILLCHPDVGVLVVEVKGHGIADIERVAAGNLFVKTGGSLVAKNAFKQAETAMFDIKTAFERSDGPRSKSPVFEFVVALPRISIAEWTAKGYDACLDRSHLLFKDDLENLHKLRTHLRDLVQQDLVLLARLVPIDTEQFDRVKGVFGDSAVVNASRTPRENVVDDTLGGMIEWAESTDKNLSPEQQVLSRLAVGTHPRVIRGVAGSGKTVVLANMVARYLRRELSAHQEDHSNSLPKVGVVCYNRSLVHFLTQRISDAFGEEFDTLAKPHLTICYLNDLLFNLKDVAYLRITRHEDPALRANYYRQQLAGLRSSAPQAYERNLFDVLFVDEGQDFVPEEYQLFRDLVRPNPTTSEKPLTVFYDNAQNVYARPRPTSSDVDIDVARGDRTRVMKQCFRNTKQIGEFGFNVLYGSQSKKTVKTREFLDLQTLLKDSLITESSDFVEIHFAGREGAEPEVMSFETRQQELEWIASEIRRLVVDEFVRLSDILVLFRTEVDFDRLPDLLKDKMSPGSIRGFVRVYRKSEDKNAYIFRDDCLTLSTINSAKGYDAPVVFLAGIDRFGTTETDRAFFYVGATRAKHILYVSGLNLTGRQETLLSEANRVQKVRAQRNSAQLVG